MTSTTLHTGGRRWWFVCPVTGKRVGKLYLPVGATGFAGRKAHDLTYTPPITFNYRSKSSKPQNQSLQMTAIGPTTNSFDLQMTAMIQRCSASLRLLPQRTRGARTKLT
jgi:hypothetical protein